MKKIQEILEKHGGGLTFSTSSPEEYYKLMCDQFNSKNGTLHTIDGYNCAKCNNKGVVAKAEFTSMGYWTRVDYICECQPIRKSLYQIKQSGLDHLLHKYRLDNYTVETYWQKAIYERALNYIQSMLECREDSCPWF